ncbi:MAG: methyltransferase [Thaumarchaeota archaeon]|nr:methyltransferase [Nitrososphaerota archaeon]
MTAKEEGPGPVAQPPFLDMFFQAVNAFHRTESLKAAIQLDLFTAIGGGAEAEVIARRCNASPRGIRILCNFLVTMGFLEKLKTDGYKLTPDSKTFLDKSSPLYMGGTVEVFLSPANVDGFKDLASVVRKGTTMLEKGGVLAPEHPVWATFARAMTPIVRMPAESLASMLGGDTRASWKVLDVAAGSGLYGIAVAKRYPNSRVVAVDWQNVLPIARENARFDGVADRYSVVPGDAFGVELGNDYDVVLITNFLHHFGPDSIEVFLSRIFRALKPGGRAVFLEVISNEDRVSPPNSVEFSLVMLASTEAGNAYTFSDYQRILERVGYSKVEIFPLPPTPFRVVFAQKKA